MDMDTLHKRNALGRLAGYFCYLDIDHDEYLRVCTLFGIKKYANSNFWISYWKTTTISKQIMVTEMLIHTLEEYPNALPFVLQELIRISIIISFKEILEKKIKVDADGKNILNLIEISKKSLDNHLFILGYRFEIDNIGQSLDFFDVNIFRIDIDDNRNVLRNQLHNQLERDYPDIYISLRGAYERYSQMGTDYERQTLGSCRVALESLVKKISKREEWREGLRTILLGSVDQITLGKSKDFEKYLRGLNNISDDVATYLLIIQLYHFFSKKQAHSSSIPKKEEAELGLQLTEDIIMYLISRR